MSCDTAGWLEIHHDVGEGEEGRGVKESAVRIQPQFEYCRASIELLRE